MQKYYQQGNKILGNGIQRKSKQGKTGQFKAMKFEVRKGKASQLQARQDKEI